MWISDGALGGQFLSVSMANLENTWYGPSDDARLCYSFLNIPIGVQCGVRRSMCAGGGGVIAGQIHAATKVVQKFITVERY